jgi:hypothetical protein
VPDSKPKDAGGDVSERSNVDEESLKGLDVLSLHDLDPALNRKMHLVNNVSVERQLVNDMLKIGMKNIVEPSADL